MRDLLLLTRVELRRLLRTDEVWRYVLVPALFGLPILLFGAVLLVSARGPAAHVAVPRDLPNVLAITEQLEANRCAVVASDDPAADWERGRVDAAIVSWRDEDGLGRRAVSAFGEDESRWSFQVAASDTDVESRVRQALSTAGSDWLADTVALAGGTDADLEPVDIRLDLLEQGSQLPFDPVRAALAYGVFSIGLLAFFLLSLPAVADRREGVTETLRTLPIRPGAVVTARVLALVAVQLTAALFISINLVLLALPALANLDVPHFPWARLPGLLATLLLADAGYALIGTVAPSARVANSTSSFPMTVQLALLVYGVLADAPVWVPMAGVLSARTPIEHAIATLSTLVATVVILRICGWLLETRVALVLRKGDD